MRIEFDWDDMFDEEDRRDLRVAVLNAVEELVVNYVKQQVHIQLEAEHDVIAAAAKFAASQRVQKALKALEVEV